jgi:hypothetical protein
MENGKDSEKAKKFMEATALLFIIIVMTFLFVKILFF